MVPLARILPFLVNQRDRSFIGSQDVRPVALETVMRKCLCGTVEYQVVERAVVC